MGTAPRTRGPVPAVGPDRGGRRLPPGTGDPTWAAGVGLHRRGTRAIGTVGDPGDHGAVVPRRWNSGGGRSPQAVTAVVRGRPVHRVRRVAGQRKTSAPRLPDRSDNAQRRGTDRHPANPRSARPAGPPRALPPQHRIRPPCHRHRPPLPRDTNQAGSRRGTGKLAKSRGISDDDRIMRAVPPDEAQVLQPPEVLAELLRGPSAPA